MFWRPCLDRWILVLACRATSRISSAYTITSVPKTSWWQCKTTCLQQPSILDAPELKASSSLFSHQMRANVGHPMLEGGKGYVGEWQGSPSMRWKCISTLATLIGKESASYNLVSNILIEFLERRRFITSNNMYDKGRIWLLVCRRFKAFHVAAGQRSSWEEDWYEHPHLGEGMYGNILIIFAEEPLMKFHNMM